MMMNGWLAFRNGLSLTLRYRWVLLILFAVNLVSALSLAALPALSLASGLGHRTAIHQAADGVDAWMVAETVMSPLTYMILEQEGAEPRLPPGLQQGGLLVLFTAALLPLVSWLPASFLSGGLLLTYAEAPQPFDPSTGSRRRRLRMPPFDRTLASLRAKPQAEGSVEPLRTLPFRWRRFLWGCWHWFGAFLLLGAVQGVASVVVFVSVITAAVAAIAVVGGWLAWAVVPLLALVAVLWLALMEITRIAAVVGETRNVARAFGQAVRFMFRRFLPVAGLYGLALLLLFLLHALFRGGLMPRLPLDRWPLVLLVQQTFILARLWARLVRLAGGVVLVSQFAIRNSPVESAVMS